MHPTPESFAVVVRLHRWRCPLLGLVELEGYASRSDRPGRGVTRLGSVRYGRFACGRAPASCTPHTALPAMQTYPATVAVWAPGALAVTPFTFALFTQSGVLSRRVRCVRP